MLSTVALLLIVAAPAPLKWDPAVDGSVTGALVAAWLVSETALKPALAPDACRWCETNGFDTSVRSVFNPGLLPSSGGVRGISTASDLIGFGALTIGIVGLDALLALKSGATISDVAIDLLLVIESSFSALMVNQVTKFAVGRARPYAIGNANPSDTDKNLSFFSGHTTFTFAAAASAGTIAMMRGYKAGWLLWLVGGALATTTGILRIAADKHWASDVLIGMAVGTAAGVLMPALLHGRVGGAEVRVTPAANGLQVVGTF